MPIVDDNPFMSNVSLMEIGTPNKGCKNSSIFSSGSLNVQLRFFDAFLTSSHFSASLMASSKLTSVMRFSLNPMVAVRQQ